jgi:uncharacterized protein (DUF1697 family)
MEWRMTTFIALLRGINVSGKNRIRMQELRISFESLKLSGVETYIQSGNVIFDCEGIDPENLSGLIEGKIVQSFGTPVQVLLRDLDNLIRIVENNPFRPQVKFNPEKLHITFLSQTPRLQETTLTGKQNGDEFQRKGCEVYLYCPDGYGRTKFSNTYFEKVMGVPATTRNWKTVNALIEIANKRVS